MYKIPENFNFSKLIGKHVDQISFGQNYAMIFIDADYIQFSGAFQLFTNEQTVSKKEVFLVENDSGLLHLLGARVLKIESKSNGRELLLEFSENSHLTLFSDDLFESFNVSIDGFLLVI